MMRVAILLLALAVVLSAGEEQARKRFYDELEKTYDYLPADVDQSVRDEGVRKMERFFAFVASDLETYLPLVREALRDKKQNAYFYFDGSALLIEHSQTKSDYELAVNAISRCRLEDVGRKGYFYFTHKICKQDVDAYPIVVKMLEDPKFGFYLVQHALRVEQPDAVILCLLCQGEERWCARLAARLDQEKDMTATCTILFCLSTAMTKEARAALRRFTERENLDPDLKDYATSLLRGMEKSDLPPREVTWKREEFEVFLKEFEAEGSMPDVERTRMLDGFYLVRKKDEPRIRAARRKAARRVSDEALLELRYLTKLLSCAVLAKE
jgi:hypothetical protein